MTQDGPFIIVICVVRHLMIFERAGEKQIYATREQADKDASELKAKRDSHKRKLYESVTVLEYTE